MNKEEILYCVKVHKEVVMTQVLDTKRLRKAANLILGRPEETLIAPNIARQTVFSWYTHHAKAFLAEFEEALGVDETDTVEPVNSAASPLTKDGKSDTQSHTEDVNYVGIKQPLDLKHEGDEFEKDSNVDTDKELTEDEKQGIHLADEVNHYRNLVDANPTPENKKKLRIAKMKQTKWVKKNV